MYITRSVDLNAEDVERLKWTSCTDCLIFYTELTPFHAALSERELRFLAERSGRTRRHADDRLDTLVQVVLAHPFGGLRPSKVVSLPV